MQIRAASKYTDYKIPKKTSHHLLEVTDFIPTTTGLEQNKGKKRVSFESVCHGHNCVQVRVGTEGKEDKFLWP